MLLSVGFLIEVFLPPSHKDEGHSLEDTQDHLDDGKTACGKTCHNLYAETGAAFFTI